MESTITQGNIMPINLLPYPQHIEVFDGGIELRKISRRVVYPKFASPRIVASVDRFWKLCDKREDASASIPLVISCDKESDRYPQFGMIESYVVSISSESVEVRSQTEWGILRGLVTLSQLIRKTHTLPFCYVEDSPRYGWRGLLVDVSRHYISCDAMKRTIDGMVWSKLNVLHIHLTDDQAFRFPSKLVAAADDQYSVTELLALVEYAADRGIRVVPEIDMPGHVSALVSVVPELGVVPNQPTDRFGQHRACLDPTKESVYKFLRELLEEVVSIFPDHYIHLGGDELDLAEWKENKKIQDWVSDNNLSGVEALQTIFTSRLREILLDFDRALIGWDEILDSSLSNSVVIQSWRGADSRDLALTLGHPCIVSTNYYLDLFYPMDIHYRFDPEGTLNDWSMVEENMLEDPRFAHVADAIRRTSGFVADNNLMSRHSSGVSGQVIGGEACLWTELVNEPLLDIRIWSRLPAIAERLWSSANLTDLNNLYVRQDLWMQGLNKFAGINPARSSDDWMLSLGIGSHWLDMIHILEPVKWYSRLLGEEGMQARLAGNEVGVVRVYDANSPLDSIIDGLLPESIEIFEIYKLCKELDSGNIEAHRALLAKSRVWKELSMRDDAPEDLGPMLPELHKVADLLGRLLTNDISKQDALAGFKLLNERQGDYILAVVPFFITWLSGSVH